MKRREIFIARNAVTISRVGDFARNVADTSLQRGSTTFSPPGNGEIEEPKKKKEEKNNRRREKRNSLFSLGLSRDCCWNFVICPGDRPSAPSLVILPVASPIKIQAGRKREREGGGRGGKIVHGKRANGIDNRRRILEERRTRVTTRTTERR